jgi:WD40 repeat protein
MGGGSADRCLHIWDALTGQAVKQVDTGSQVSNVAWSKHSPELVSFLHIRVVLSFVVEMVFLTKVRFLFYIRNRS